MNLKSVVNKIYFENFGNRVRHRALKSNSHKRFGTRDFAIWVHILDHGESKKDFRNRSAQCRPSRDSNPGPLREHLLD